jgi:predicted alpha/beta hydrolase
VRRVIAWLRAEEGAERVGLFGHSLGGHVVSLAAGLEDGLHCVIAGIPVVDLPDLFRRHSPPHIAKRAEAHGVLGPMADEVHRVVSPLTFACRVPARGRFIFGGLGDRMSTFGHAHRLWLHWERPRLAAYSGGHVGFYWSGAARQLVTDALTDSGLLDAA